MSRIKPLLVLLELGSHRSSGLQQKAQVSLHHLCVLIAARARNKELKFHYIICVSRFDFLQIFIIINILRGNNVKSLPSCSPVHSLEVPVIFLSNYGISAHSCNKMSQLSCSTCKFPPFTMHHTQQNSVSIHFGKHETSWENIKLKHFLFRSNVSEQTGTKWSVVKELDSSQLSFTGHEVLK